MREASNARKDVDDCWALRRVTHGAWYTTRVGQLSEDVGHSMDGTRAQIPTGVSVRFAMPEHRKACVAAIRRWGSGARRIFPWRGERDTYRLMVAESLLQRSSAARVADVYGRLIRRWPTAASLGRADLLAIAKVVSPLGLSFRAARLRAAAALLSQQSGGRISERELLHLPGVGLYVARAILAAKGKKVALVDNVSARVYKRLLGLDPGLRPRDMWTIVDWFSPPRSRAEWNWAVLDLAAAICAPKNPLCEKCPARRYCAFAESRGAP